MKIVKIEPIPVAYPEPNDFGAERYLCLVKITTDEGIVGWGESITQFKEVNAAVAALINGLSEFVLGQDPLNNAAIWRSIKERYWWYGYRGGMACYALSAIDIALWDIKGKALGVSVLELLGGPVHERLPSIASGHAHDSSIPKMAEEVQGWLSTGLQGMKVGFGKRGNAHLGYEHDRDVEYVKSMREAIGPDKKLIIDLGYAIKWDVATAVKRVQAFDDYNIDWIEEPLGAWDPEGYRSLRDKTKCLIAYGEREWNVDGFDAILETGTCDVFGIDPGRAEGITGFMKAVDRIHSHRRQANAHAWSSAIVSAASLAVSFTSPAFKLFEVKPLENPMQHELVTEPIRHKDGWVYPPLGKPGLGIEIVEDVVDRYRQKI